MGTGLTNIKTANIKGRCVYAIWFYYIVEPIAVNVIYAERFEKREGLVHAWHPSSISKRIFAGALRATRKD